VVMIVGSLVMTSTTLAAGWKVEGSPPAFGAVGRMPWGLTLEAEALVFDKVIASLF
jgi:hypothetical protein